MLEFAGSACQRTSLAIENGPSGMVYSCVPQRILGMIPARYASSRFPGKAIANLAGKPMLQHGYERACLARYLSHVEIATDDVRIAYAARAFHAPVRMTRSDHVSVTDRVDQE